MWIHHLHEINVNAHPAVSPSKVCWSTTSRLWTSTSSPKEVSWGEVLLGKSLLELTLLERACKDVDLWDGTGGDAETKSNLINSTNSNVDFCRSSTAQSAPSAEPDVHHFKSGKHLSGHHVWGSGSASTKSWAAAVNSNTNTAPTCPFGKAAEPSWVDTTHAVAVDLAEGTFWFLSKYKSILNYAPAFLSWQLNPHCQYSFLTNQTKDD